MTSIIKVNTVQDVDGNNIINENANTITVGASGDTIIIPSGATITNNGTQTGFGRTGTVDWVTTPKTSTFTAVNGEGYFINQGSQITANLPAGSAGAIVAFSDYARNFATYNFTVSPNGSEKIGGIVGNATLGVDGQAATFVYVDSTKGWVNIQNAEDTETGAIPYSADFLVIAGGGSGGTSSAAGNSEGGGGGGAGGYRTSTQTITPGNTVTVTVGDGGAAISPSNTQGNSGTDSSISGTGYTTITSAGGGGGGRSTIAGTAGGSGGGGGAGPSPFSAGGAGDTPSTTPAQGNNGGAGSDNSRAGAGGGAGGAGNAGSPSVPGNGGAGAASSITGGSVTRAGGGGGGNYDTSIASTGGSGGGGAGGGHAPAATPGVAGTTNTGSGGGGTSFSNASGAGGKGIVIISVPDADYSGTTTGSPTVATGVSGKTVMTFNSSGSYTA